MIKSSTKRTPVQFENEKVKEWAMKQQNFSKSVNLLIMRQIAKQGITDVIEDTIMASTNTQPETSTKPQTKPIEEQTSVQPPVEPELPEINPQPTISNSQDDLSLPDMAENENNEDQDSDEKKPSQTEPQPNLNLSFLSNGSSFN